MVFALLSSYEDIPLSQKICFAGEIGLSGEIRAVNRIDQRISEAEKLGFESIVISKYNRKSEPHKGIKTISVALIEEVYSKIFK
jgi:DNA repair protein RadA/Sms